MLRIMMTLMLALLLPTGGAGDGMPRPFAIEVVDAATGRGVPLVELKTVNNIRFVTDSNGLVAVFEPELMGQTVFFHVHSHGYEFPKDGFGYRGKAFKIESGGAARLELQRVNIAERLYRVTGGGIYRDTVLLGRKAPLPAPTLDGLVFGSDSVLAAVYQGKIHWFWGDTSRPAYPLGNFHTPGATSRLPKDGGLDPEIGVALEYYVDADGFAKPTAKMPGDGPTWLGGLTVLRDAAGRERMYAGYVKVRNLLDAYAHGLAVWDDAQAQFRQVAVFPEGLPLYPTGHTFQRDGFVYFCTPFPLTRVRADAESLADPRRYEGFTCLKAGTRPNDKQLDRGPDGRLHYAWKANTPPLGQDEQDTLTKSGALRPEEALLALRDADTGRAVRGHGGTVSWNAYRKRWVLIAVESGGESSFLGEVWYAEADAPTGPWVYARKILTHDKYSFYNPKQHPFFDKDGGRVIFFEGTYANTFSGNSEQTPRYDYNQMMYQLDLSDARLNLPSPLYDLSDSETFGARQPNRPTAFFALERPGGGTVPIFARRGKPGLQVGASATPLFYALPVETKNPPATVTPLYEFVNGSRHAYSTDSDWSRPGFRRAPQPLCLVWKRPTRAV